MCVCVSVCVSVCEAATELNTRVYLICIPEHNKHVISLCTGLSEVTT